LDYGWKHGEPSIGLNIPSIFITKDVYSWLWSIYNFAILRTKIFHIEENTSFFEFVTREYVWDSDISGQGSERVYHQAITPIHHWLNMNKKWLEKSIHIKYEYLLLNSEGAMNYISSLLNCSMKDSIVFPSEIIKPACALSVGQTHSNVFDKIDFIRNKEYMNFFCDDLLEFVNLHLNQDVLVDLNYAQL
jgi:hypothetical protein